MSSPKSSTDKPLLVFAHPGEAQVFIQNDHLDKIQDSPKLYRGNHYYLLITGGGMEKTLYGTACILSQAQITGMYSKIINLGIATSLSPEIKLHNIYTIATAYAYREGKAVYESFPLSIPPGSRTFNIRDCLTTIFPITHFRTRQRLSAFADIADMELWWIAYAVKGAMSTADTISSIPLRAVKLISDHAHKPSRKNIQSQSKFYSQELYNFYYQQIVRTAPISYEHSRQDSKASTKIAKNKIFTALKITHQTQSQRRIIDSLLTQLIEKYSDKDEIKTEKILSILQSEIKKSSLSQVKSEQKNPKKTTKTIIEILKKEVFPISQGYHRRLMELTELISADGIDIDYDTRLESSEITTSFTASSLEEWQRKKQNLKSIPINKVFSTLNGKDHV